MATDDAHDDLVLDVAQGLTVYVADLTDHQKAALEHARYLAERGVPLFLAEPALDPEGNRDPKGGHQGTGYWFPKRWQLKEADPAVVDRWRPGWALCAVTGHLLDVVDVDPRSGGNESLTQMLEAGLVPRSYGRQSTPSGGTHDFIATLGVRSLDKTLPGVDIKAGDLNGNGRGFAFLAPTEKLSKTTGEVGVYDWTVPPNLEALIIPGVAADDLAIIGLDDTGVKLAELVRRRGRTKAQPYTGPSYDGAEYSDLSPAERRLADTHVKSVVGLWRDRLTEALDLDEGDTDGKGRGWEKLSRDAAWAVAKTAAAPWTGLDEDRAHERYLELLPDEFAATEECTGKWYAGIVANAAKEPVEPPWWTEYLPLLAAPAADWPEVPNQLDDAHMAAWMAHKGLDGHWCWAGGLGWLHWDGRRWHSRREEDAREAVRLAAIEVNRRAMLAGISVERMRKLTGLLSTGRIGALTTLIKGVVSVDGGAFDQQPHLLNCGNGVVDLRTSQLLAHDPAYLLTKLTETPFIAGATHPDWDKALRALEPEVADWMQVRLGQAATGHPTSDDILPIGQGGGSNGKSTIVAALHGALGGHMVQVPEKLLRAGPNDHPTELMTLYGARVAVIDETPEVAVLNVQRLKATLGSEYVTARPVHKDNVTWKATHSMFAFTNYAPQIRESDHGTWRRLALVVFSKTFPRDDRFRARMARGAAGRREAVLAWVVDGARRWYDNDRVIAPMPARVEADTVAWRGNSDQVMAYLLSERIMFDPATCVLAADLLTDFNEWLTGLGHQPWGSQTFANRFGNHEEVTRHHVVKKNPREPAGLVLRWGGDDAGLGRPKVWLGIRWRTTEDP